MQNGLGLKCMRGLIRGKICGIYDTDNLTKEKNRKYMRSEFEIIKDFGDKKSKYPRNDIMEKVIKTCGGVKKSNDGLNKLDKKKNRENFRVLLGFKENEIYESKEHSVLKKIRKMLKNQIISQ